MIEFDKSDTKFQRASYPIEVFIILPPAGNCKECLDCLHVRK